MNIVVPYTVWPAELHEHLFQQGMHPHYADTSQPEGYYLLLSRLWATRETVLVLEADKFPAPGVLAELWRCPEPWCTVAVAMRGTEEPAPYPSLSCTKFASRLMYLVPDLMEHVGELDLGLGAREWSRLDLAIHGLLDPYGSVHYHEGLVEHRHADR